MRRDVVAGVPVARFPALDVPGGWLRHGFVERLAGLDVEVDREEALLRLNEHHRRVVELMGFGVGELVVADQVHGAAVAWVEKEQVSGPVTAVDGLATRTPGLALGIYVADCCAVFIVDPVRRAVALLHSGRRGSESGIVRHGIGLLHERASSRPADLVVQLSPCIRPPCYEVDFASWIRRDAEACGVPATHIHDDGVCTASDLDHYYSYRAEKGRTGRMLALLGIVREKSG